MGNPGTRRGGGTSWALNEHAQTSRKIPATKSAAGLGPSHKSRSRGGSVTATGDLRREASILYFTEEKERKFALFLIKKEEEDEATLSTGGGFLKEKAVSGEKEADCS